jgi:type VI secretion system protein ImpC
MNTAYVLGVKLTEAYAKYGSCIAIRGFDGGFTEGLPTDVFMNDEGDVNSHCPVEIGITNPREAVLSKLGFLPLCPQQNSSMVVFYSASTARNPAKHAGPKARIDAEIALRLPFVMVTSRIMHYLMIMARDKVGPSGDRLSQEEFFNRWISKYIGGVVAPMSGMEIRFLLAEGKIQVNELANAPDVREIVASLRPWLPNEELTAPVRIVARMRHEMSR